MRPGQRVTAAPESEFVVFLIGMRLHRLRSLRRTWGLFSAMSRMIRELAADPASGFLGGESWIGNPTIMVQYWQSFADIECYAHDPNREHRRAWAAFNRLMTERPDAGVWHEAYLVRPGDFETVYNNMPPFGLARATRIVQAEGRRRTAAGRFDAGSSSAADAPHKTR